MKAAWPIIRAGDALRSGSVWVWQDGPWHFYTYIWRQPHSKNKDAKLLYKINVFPKHAVPIDKAITKS